MPTSQGVALAQRISQLLRRGRWFASGSALVLIVACATLRLHAAGDVVLYASDFTNIRGAWAIVDDASAAGGASLSTIDNGWPAAESPRPMPADYVEATFSAPASTAYHVWLRLR